MFQQKQKRLGGPGRRIRRDRAIEVSPRPHGDHVTRDQFKAGLAELDARIANAETRLTWRMLGIAGLVLAVLRLLG